MAPASLEWVAGIIRRMGRRRLPPVRTMAVLALILVGVAGSGVYMTFRGATPLRLQRFSSYEELALFVQSHRIYVIGFPSSYGMLQGEGAPRNSGGYSQTNVQVEGVDEPDYVKTDGLYLYTVTEDKVMIIRAYPPEEARVVGWFKPAGTPSMILLLNSQLVVISTIYEPCGSPGHAWEVSVSVEILNVDNPSALRLLQWMTLEGEYLGARLIGSYLYLVAKSQATLLNGAVKLPTLHVRGSCLTIPAWKIYYDPNVHDYNFDYAIILILNVAYPESTPLIHAFLTGSHASVLYASPENLYIATTRYQQGWFTTSTIIHRIRIGGKHTEYVTSGVVPGYLISQFALDEYDGYLRVATTKYVTLTGGEGFQYMTKVSNVYVLDMQLRVVGRLEGLAPDETIYSVRFMGPTGYVVTFRKVDPLFVIDLSCPQHPRLLGELWMTGYSDYLHPLGDHYLLGIGKEVIPDPEDDMWWYQGVKISIFNATDPCHPVELARLVLGDRGTDSPALYDHHAVLIDPNRQLLVIPLLLAVHPTNATDLPPWKHGEYVWQGACIFTVDPYNATLVLRGRVSHIPDHTQPLDVLNYTSYLVSRALYIGNVLYTVSESKVAMHDLATLTLLGEMDLTVSPAGPYGIR